MMTPPASMGLTGRALAAALVVSSTAAANVNLEWRVAVPVVRVGDTVEVGLYAVSDDQTDQSFMGLDAIISWNPDVLELVGNIDNGPFAWTFSWFPNDCEVDALNADCEPGLCCIPYTGIILNDGDAFYQALALLPMTQPADATPLGLLVTTIRFTALDVTAATQVGFVKTAGTNSFTRVVNASEGATGLVTGTLTPATFSIAPCGTQGDFDNDCVVRLADVGPFVPCLTGPDASQGNTACDAADVDLDGDADLRDVAALQLMFAGP